MRRCLYVISASLLLFATPLPDKKEQLLQISKKYFPEHYIIIKEYDQQHINEIIEGTSVVSSLGDIATVVHEAWHAYEGEHYNYDDPEMIFRINDSLQLSVATFKTFPSHYVNSIVPAAVKKKIFRYADYVGTREKYLVTQQYGILGLLEEAIAYYHSFNTDLSLFNYINDTNGWKETQPWMNWLGQIASYRYSFYEFKLFISWYLQYAKSYQPEVYKAIIKNKGLKSTYQFLEKENTRLITKYNQNRKEILDRFKGRLKVEENYIYDQQTLQGAGLYDNELNYLHDLLEAPEHQILDVLLK